MARDRNRPDRQAGAGDTQHHDGAGQQQAVLGADAAHQQRRQEQAARFNEDLQRVQVAEHGGAGGRIGELRGEVARELLVVH
jgi:hypothetical protein